MSERWLRLPSPRHWLFGSLRRQLVTGMVLTIAGMLIPFVLWVAANQATEARHVQVAEAEVFAANLAASSAVWVGASDIGGLRDIVGSFARYSSIRHVLVTDRQGQVLAHNDASLIGKYLGDLPTLASPAILRQDERLVDVVAPIMLGGTHIGWARIGLDQAKTIENIARIKRNSLLLVLAALVLGALFATYAARRLTQRLTVIEEVAHVQKNGQMTLRAQVDGDDEAARLAHQFNAMLDVLNRREAELTQSHDELEQRVAERTAALEEQNRRNALIVSAAMDGFFVADMNGRMLDCNDTYCAMLGYARDELLKLHIPEIEAMESPEEVAYHIGRVMEFGRDRFDTCHRRKDGSLVDVEINVTLAAVGAQRQFFTFVHDISAHKHNEAELIAARNNAETANAAKSEFLSRMSHELRTPLNAIIGFAQMLALPGKSSLTAQQADNVQEILKAGQHLLVQVNEVLDLARIESGRIELRLEPLPLAPLIKDCVAQVQPLAAARGIAIAAHLNETSDESLALQGDYTRVKQVLLNLLSNAIKYNRDGGQIHVAAVAAGEQMRIEMRDTGRGIAPDKRERLFKPFERLESSYDGIEGTGIGLALVKRLVEAMGGEIGVDSEEGIGSTFWFALPAARLPSPPVTPSQKVGAGGTAPVAPASPQAQCRVLYIEDNPANLKLIRKIIGMRAGFALLDAMNAELGLEIARRERPDLILLDINLPGMDGFAAIAQLQAWPETATIPVIAVTANAMKHDIDRGKSAGFADYLTKPIDIPRLHQMLDILSAGEQP